MKSNSFIKVKRPIKPLLTSERPSSSPTLEEVEALLPVEAIEIEQPEQPEPTLHLRSLAETPRDESIYGSGWSIAQLMTEFTRR